MPAKKEKKPKELPLFSIPHSPLTDKKLLAKNTIWNLIGQIGPALVAVVSIPIIIHQLGPDRFGILTLAWAVVGYFSLFDFGLGRAVTQLISQKLGSKEEMDLPPLIWTALMLLSGFGFLGALIAFLVSPLLVQKLLHVSDSLQSETLICFYIMALSIPLVTASNVFNGILEAKQKFNIVNLIRIPLGVANFLGPLFVLPFTLKTYWLVAMLAVTRFVGLGFYISACFREFPALKKERSFNWKLVKILLGFGGWMTVSNIISPLMVSLDRFLIGAVLSLSAVAYYVTPYEISNKLMILSSPMVRVLFPAFSTSHQNDLTHSKNLLKESVKFLFSLMFPVILAIVLFSKEGLTLWLGADFASHCVKVLQLITIGVFINILAQILFAYVQGAGRPDLTAKNHIAELPLYLLCLYLMLKKFGIEGAATAWLLRVILDAGLLYWQTHNLALRGTEWIPKKLVWMAFATMILMLFPCVTFFPVFLKAALFIILTFAFSFLTWSYYFEPEERTLLLKLCAAISKKTAVPFLKIG